MWNDSKQAKYKCTCTRVRTRIFLSFVNAHQKVTSEEDFNDQEDKRTCFEDTPQSLSLATSIIAQWAHEKSGCSDRAGSYAQAQQLGLPFIKADYQSLICQKQRLPATKPLRRHHSQSDQQVDYIGLLPLWKEQHFVLTEINTLDMDLPSLHVRGLNNPHIFIGFY